MLHHHNRTTQPKHHHLKLMLQFQVQTKWSIKFIQYWQIEIIKVKNNLPEEVQEHCKLDSIAQELNSVVTKQDILKLSPASRKGFNIKERIHHNPLSVNQILDIQLLEKTSDTFNHKSKQRILHEICTSKIYNENIYRCNKICWLTTNWHVKS